MPLALPWDALRDAEERLTSAQQLGDALAVESAQADVRVCREAVGALFAEMMIHALATDGVRFQVGRSLDALGPIDFDGRAILEDLSKCVTWLSEEIAGLRQTHADLRREVENLRRERDTEEHGREEADAATG